MMEEIVFYVQQEKIGIQQANHVNALLELNGTTSSVQLLKIAEEE